MIVIINNYAVVVLITITIYNDHENIWIRHLSQRRVILSRQLISLSCSKVQIILLIYIFSDIHIACNCYTLSNNWSLNSYKTTQGIYRVELHNLGIDVFSITSIRLVISSKRQRYTIISLVICPDSISIFGIPHNPIILILNTYIVGRILRAHLCIIPQVLIAYADLQSCF